MSPKRIIGIVAQGSLEQRELALDLESFFRPRWSPDGRSIMVRGFKGAVRPSFYIVDVATGNLRMAVPGGADNVNGSVRSRDGETVYYIHLPDRPPTSPSAGRIVAKNLKSGAETELFLVEQAFSLGDRLIHDLAISPDGKQLAFVLDDVKQKAIRVIPTAGRSRAEIHECDRRSAFALAQ